MYVFYHLLSIFSVLGFTTGKIFTIQADENRNRENHPVWELTNSSNGNAVILEPKKRLDVNFCLRKDAVVSVVDFRFSNGNWSDVVVVEIDNLGIGWFRSPVDPSHNWNKFLSTGPFQGSWELLTGWHTLNVRFNGTADGLAVDHVMLNIDDDQMSQDIFSCKLTCIPDQRYQLRANDVTTSPSFLVQESYKTVCPEVDNINMPLFNQGVQMYEITAAMPQYRSFSNWRSENNTGCPHLSPYYWDFSNVQIDTDTRPIMQSAKAKLYSTGGKRKDSRISILILISFTLEGKSKGMLDSEMGTILKVRFADVTSPIQVQYQFKGRKPGISLPEPQTVTRTNMAVEWNTDDFSWTDGDYNVIFLQVTSNSTRPLHLEHISLERRPMLPDTIMQVFKGDDTIVEVVFSDFWWTNPDAMTVHIAATGKSYDNVSYFRVYRPIPWSDGYAQVFVLYQDGNARLLPVPPQGLDWIPFGSSVIIGQTDPTVVRPYASITEAFIDETNLKIDLKYMDGGSCKLSIASSLSETRVTVSDIKLSRNPMMYPFATFRSMYVEEGNSDVDSVMVNGVLPHHIMDDFPYLIGRSFVFHRKCMSRHLMLSPDIYIDIRRTDVRETTIEPTNSFQTLIQRIQNHRYRLWTPRLRYTYPRL